MENLYRFIEVCAGCGGMSSGFEKAGFFPILLNDVDKTCCDTLAKNKREDSTKISNASMNDINYDEYIDICDVLVGGVPCQAFSQAGKRKGFKDERGNLILTFKELIKKLHPKVFVVENVKGLLTHEKGETFRQVLNSLSCDDTYTLHYKILNAMNYEVPQKRERVFIIGTKSNESFEFPESTTKRIVLKDVLENCPESDIGMKYPQWKKDVLDHVPPGGCWVNLPEEIQKEYMGKAFESGGGKRGMARRLHMDEPCLTLTTSPCQKQTERCHPLETRPLTVREYARIQTFPDSYIFSGSIAQKYKQIGNAVPVNLAYHIAMAVKKYLDNLNLVVH